MTALDKNIIGRDDANDIDAILAMRNEDVEASIKVVQNNADSIFTWDYERALDRA